ncbi:MAG: hypothetical protein A4E28_02702 [Methanocella sp. PtaU1.Bin125]|nr:MAG: hypothetical protein A4E28_02702 [Methanocella sp. PtaU1.Bin125]
MVLRILLGAFFGALFGFLLGWFIELFPRFNGALVDGLGFITGIHDIRMAALLAAVGFLGGIFLGLIASVVHSTRRHWYHGWY